MTKADLIAIAVKSARPVLPNAKGIILGRAELYAIEHNPSPRDPPDLSLDGATFCGLKLIRGEVENELALVVDIYSLLQPRS